MKRIAIPALSLMLAAALAGCGDDNGGVIGSTAKNIELESMPGAAVTRRECGSCHFLDKTVRKVGPSLKGIYGQKPRTRGIPVEVWNAETLSAWIENPTGVYPDTKMKIPGIKDAEKRALIVEYLKQI